MSTFTRRAILTSAGAFAGAYALPSFAQTTGPRIAVIGGGFAGGTAARELAKLIPNADVILISEGLDEFVCPLSNLALADQEIVPLKTRQDGTIAVRNRFVRSITNNLQIEENDGHRLPPVFDFIIIAPGIALDFDKLEGYSNKSVRDLPHAWQSAEQNKLLRKQLYAMPDGGTVIITTPPAPYRCPPGPYERASLIAHYLKTHKPKSKVLLLDSNQTFSKQALFEAAWERFYPGIIERRGPNDDGRVIGVNANAKSVITDFDEISGDVVNVIPPQRAGEIARIAGVTDASGWCPVDPVTFESTLRKNIFVIGDAAQVSPMPKSAFAAAQQARICALNLARRIEGLEPIAPIMSNTCYSFLTPERACSITGVYQAEGRKLLPVSGAGGQSPIADEALEVKEAGQAKAIIDSLLRGAFG